MNARLEMLVLAICAASVLRADGVRLECADPLGRGLRWEIQAKRNPADRGATLRSEEADAVTVYPVDANGVRRIGYVFVDGDEPVKEVMVLIERNTSGETRGRIAVVPAKGWHLNVVRFPLVDLPLVRGDDPSDDCLITGTAKGGYYVNPAQMKPGTWMMNGRHPGQSSAQFAASWDGESGVYFGLEDTQGHRKEYGFERTAEGLRFYNRVLIWTDSPWQLEYSVVLREVKRTGEKLTWYDFADIYRDWDRRQYWSQTPYLKRADIPAWMKDAPAFVRFSRQWLERPAAMKKFVDMWKREIGEMPVVAALWGWEKYGTWWGPDYFPCHPDDATFRSEMEHLRANDFHPFAWPSGYNWSKYIGDKGNGTYEVDLRRTWIEPNTAHICVNPDGKLFHRDAFWLRNGALTTICGGDPWSRTWFDEVAKGLAERGCELVQVDQVVGGRINDCWTTGHGHPIGPGAWQWAAFSEQLASLRKTLRAVRSDCLVGVEEPCELMNDRVAIQDYRDIETYGDRLADIYGYLFHGYVPTFQSNPFRDEMNTLMYSAVNGQMPFVRPDFAELEVSRPALVNGGFEDLVDSVRGPAGWDRLIPNRLLRGVDPRRPLWNFSGANNMGWLGYAVTLDYEVKHTGSVSLKFDPPAKGGLDNGVPMQVSQTIEELAPGDYTISAWVRSDDVTAPTGELKLGFVGSGEAKAIPFPATREWTKIEAKIAVENHLRLIIWAPPGARFHIDDLSLEKDGDEVRVQGDSKYMRFMKRWIALYRGPGRDFLANGFRVKPPQLDCAKVRFAAREEPAVLVAAYRSQKGAEALAFGNPTDCAQTFSYRWKEQSITRTLAPNAMELVGTDTVLSLDQFLPVRVPGLEPEVRRTCGR